MDNIVKFKKKEPKEWEEHLVTLDIFTNQDGELSVSMEIAEWADDEQVFEALVAATMKFSTDQGLTEVTIEPEEPDTIH